ncbi:MAG: DUF3326 domain-containing protein [Candidatus Aenigmatarchaeota archaeon]
MFVVAQIIPTGIGARIGGFVGDATPATNLLASIADKVIAHPNVINGVELYLARQNVLYVEGYMLNRFFLGEIALKEVIGNKIGVVLDSGYKDKESIDIAINTMDAIKAVKGIDIIGYVMTERPVGVKAVKTKSGAFAGEIERPETFLDAARKLIKKGANAIAVSTVIQIKKKDLYAYLKGKGPNPYGGAEAIISHTISKTFNVPCAHAPLLTKEEMKLEMAPKIVDPRAGAEAISPAYLGCALQGLHKAPQPIRPESAKEDDITIDDISAILVPADALGGIPALVSEKRGIKIIAVEENKTVLNVTAERLGLRNAIHVKNYLEAAGLVAAMKEGIDYKTITRPLKRVGEI